MKPVRAKKKLGQHFLTDLNIAKRISDTLDFNSYDRIVEIGSGMGVLTQFLLTKTNDLFLVEIDKESVTYLKNTFANLNLKVLEADFLKLDFKHSFGTDPLQ